MHERHVLREEANRLKRSFLRDGRVVAAAQLDHVLDLARELHGRDRTERLDFNAHLVTILRSEVPQFFVTFFDDL